jgi:hypothetical protein
MFKSRLTHALIKEPNSLLFSESVNLAGKIRSVLYLKETLNSERLLIETKVLDTYLRIIMI